MRAGRRSSELLVSLALFSLAIGSHAASPPDVSAAIYWGEEASIGAANLDGTEPVFGYPDSIVGTLGGDGQVCGLAVHGGNLYWADRSSGAIGRMELRDTPSGVGRMDTVYESVAIDQSMIAGLARPCGVAIGGSHLYWASQGGLAIGRANLNGSGVEPNFIPGASAPCGVAVDAAHVYWANRSGNAIGRANLAGGEVDQSFIPGAEGPCGVAVDAGHVYWANEAGDSIGRANLAGGEVDQSFVSEVENACGVTVDNAHLYWSASFFGRVGRANLDGSGVNRDLIPNPYGISCGVAVDSRVFKPPPPPPSFPFFIGKVKRARGSAAVYVTVKVPATGGELGVEAKGLRWKFLEPPTAEGGYLLRQLKLWPGGTGKAAARIRGQLRQKGRARANLFVTYQEAGKAPVSRSRPLTLVRRRPSDKGR